jgi:hypothetical protein
MARGTRAEARKLSFTELLPSRSKRDYLKSVLAVGMKRPRLSVFLSLGGTDNKLRVLEAARRLHARHLHRYGRRRTAAVLTAHDVPNTRIDTVHEKGAPTSADYLRARRSDLLSNVPNEYVSEQVDDDAIIRRAAGDDNVPLLTNRQAARLFVGTCVQVLGGPKAGEVRISERLAAPCPSPSVSVPATRAGRGSWSKAGILFPSVIIIERRQAPC